MGDVEGALEPAEPGFAASARQVLDAAFWFNAYYGRGNPNPEAAREGGPAARWGFALEAVRQLAPRGKKPPRPLVTTIPPNGTS